MRQGAGYRPLFRHIACDHVYGLQALTLCLRFMDVRCFTGECTTNEGHALTAMLAMKGNGECAQEILSLY